MREVLRRSLVSTCKYVQVRASMCKYVQVRASTCKYVQVRGSELFRVFVALSGMLY